MAFEYDFRQRLMRLRERKNVSARTMSVALDQNPGYIHDIECGKSLPSLPMFLKICEYLHVTPGAFLEMDILYPVELSDLVEKLKTLNDRQLDHIRALVDDLTAVDHTGR
ncbi:MAG: helix-turn-helix transcriptional regulator [Firmicutes bacterium]|nr:helix-turn-helix transcriptional regulator [Bacillota bacterium]